MGIQIHLLISLEVDLIQSLTSEKEATIMWVPCNNCVADNEKAEELVELTSTTDFAKLVNNHFLQNNYPLEMWLTDANILTDQRSPNEVEWSYWNQKNSVTDVAESEWRGTCSMSLSSHWLEKQ